MRPDTRPIPVTRPSPGSVTPMSEQPDEHASMEQPDPGVEPGVDVGPDAGQDVAGQDFAGQDFAGEEFAEEDSAGEEFVDEGLDDEGLRPAAVPTATGHPAVDEVLRSLEGLDGRPVDEHVAAFEQAHEQLRRALSSAGDDSA